MKLSFVFRLASVFSVLPVALSSMPAKAQPPVWMLVHEDDRGFKFKWYVDASSIQKKGKYTLANICLHTCSEQMADVVDQDLYPWSLKNQVGRTIDCIDGDYVPPVLDKKTYNPIARKILDFVCNYF